MYLPTINIVTGDLNSTYRISIPFANYIPDMGVVHGITTTTTHYLGNPLCSTSIEVLPK
jgi:hypothetical protein